MLITHISQSIENYLDSFAGRENMQGYDPNKRVKMFDSNRDFVWPIPKWMAFIVSILTGYPIPSIVICNDEVMDGGNRSTVLMKWKNDEFKVRIGDWEGNYTAMLDHREYSRRWYQATIPVTIITGATDHEKHTTLQNYNSQVQMTNGQLFANRLYCAIVGMAASMIGHGEDHAAFPFRDLVNRVWKNDFNKTPTRNELALAVQIVIGSMKGPISFHPKYFEHFDTIMMTKAEDIDLSRLRRICEVIESVDLPNMVNRKRKAMCFKKFIGPMIHDDWNMDNASFNAKWTVFLSNAYNVLTAEQFKKILDVGTNRAQNQSRLAALSDNVRNWQVVIRNAHNRDEDDSSEE